MSALALLRCACGGNITIDSDTFTGATVETCDGACRYRGKPRPEARVINPRDRGASTERLPGTPESRQPCVEGCGRKTMTPRAIRCRECHHARSRELAKGRMSTLRGSAPRLAVTTCIDGCGRPPHAPKAFRCAECAAESIRRNKLERKRAERTRRSA